MAISLLLTALGGVVYAGFPNFSVLRILYGYWGFTTIFLFWSAMIKATRVWGGSMSQGKAFGFLDGGRGLFSAFIGTLGILIFSHFLPDLDSTIDLDQSRNAFKYVIYATSIIVALVGLLVWLFLDVEHDNDQPVQLEKISKEHISTALRLPAVWLLSLIIFCAYWAYKVTDIFSLYAEDVMLYNTIDAAKVGTYLLYGRPVVGVAIGIFADKTQPTRWLLLSFIITFIGSALFGSGLIGASTGLLFFLSTLIIAIGVYGTRSLYYAVMEQGQIPLALTGTVVGLVSLIGYTPDIIAGPIIGYFLDNAPGALGHQRVFLLLTLFSIIGIWASWTYNKLYRPTEHVDTIK